MTGYTFAFIVLILAALVLLAGVVASYLGYGPAEDAVDHRFRQRYRRELHWVHAHLVLSLVIVALLALVIPPVAYQVGWNRGAQYDAAYFQQHYTHPGLKTFHHSPRKAYAAPLPKLPTTGASIDIAHYPAVGNQGQQGACAAWASAWVLSYLYRESHLSTHPAIKFSPAWLYSHYSDIYNGGQDGGSWPTQDLEMVPTIGVPQFKVLPSPSAIVDPFYSSAQYSTVYTNAAKYRMQMGTNTLYEGNPSGLVYQEAASAISSGKPAILAINVPPSFDAATQNGGRVWYQGVETSRGGHALVGIAVAPEMTFPDGSVGGILAQNQWSTAYGLQGRVWLSRAWMAANAWSVLTLTGGTGTPLAQAAPAGPTPRALPNPAPGHKAPGTVTPSQLLGAQAGAVVKGGTGWYARAYGPFTPTMANAVNLWGDHYNVWPIGLAATIGTESGYNVYAFRHTSSLDWSCGLMQDIVANVASYVGITDPNAACQWEYNPSNAIYLGTRTYADCMTYQRGSGITWPYWYVGYNAGCAIPRAEFYNPGYFNAVAGQNFTGNFMPNYEYALVHFQGGSGPTPPPPPKPHRKVAFPLKKWRAYTAAHHRPAITTRWHGRRAWEAYIWWSHARKCGGVVTQSQWHPRGRRGLSGYMSQRFQGCVVVLWPRHPKWHPKVVAAPFLR